VPSVAGASAPSVDAPGRGGLRTTKMADENVISVLDPEVKSEVSNNGYELVHSKSPLFYDLYERKSELKHQTHYCPAAGTEWRTS